MAIFGTILTLTPTQPTLAPFVRYKYSHVTNVHLTTVTCTRTYTPP
jgi:hypothetical protein